MDISPEIEKILNNVTEDDKRALLEALVDNSSLLRMDGESVDSVDDYRHVIEKIDRFTGGVLAPEFISLVEGNPRKIEMRFRGVDVSAELAGGTDYIDNEGLFSMLNDVLCRLESERQIWMVWDSDLFGQDFGITFLSRDDRDALWVYGLPIAEDETGTQISSSLDDIR